MTENRVTVSPPIVAGRSAVQTTIDSTVRFRRVATAIALPAAFALQVVTNALYSWATRDGGGDTGTGDQTLGFYGAHAQEMLVATVASLIGSLLVVPGILAALKVLRGSKPRLSLIAGILMIAGYVSYFGIVFTNFITIALAQGQVDAGAALDAAQGSVAIGFFLIFVVGNIIGTALLGLAVILSKTLSWLAGAAILAWPVSHIVGLTVGSEWFEVAGGTLEVVGLAVVAAAALRMSNAQWAARG